MRRSDAHGGTHRNIFLAKQYFSNRYLIKVDILLSFTIPLSNIVQISLYLVTYVSNCQINCRLQTKMGKCYERITGIKRETKIKGRTLSSVPQELMHSYVNNGNWVQG